jgi:heptaprenyl diphosphate synthase
MVNRCVEDICLQEEVGRGLTRAFAPISREMQAMQKRLAAVLIDAHSSVRGIVDFLLETPGKRIRPALVLLSAKAAHGGSNGFLAARNPTVDTAVAVEIIHMASLVHDDLIDDAAVRHHRPSVHVQWGKRIAVKLGDYLCAKAFGLVADCADPRLFALLGPQLCAMCTGEMEQVVDRGDFRLGASDCLAMVEKKTAALFGACCGVGAVTVGSEPGLCLALQEFGRCFGIAFQLLDDCRDFLSDREGLGKMPGQDLQAGDVTLPLLYALESRGWRREGTRNQRLMGGRELAGIREAFRSSAAPARTAKLITSYVEQAKRALRPLADSEGRECLFELADHMVASASRVLSTGPR